MFLSSPTLVPPPPTEAGAGGTELEQGGAIPGDCLVCLEPVTRAHDDMLVGGAWVSFRCECSVVAHTECLQTWLARRRTCPNCHQPVRYAFRRGWRGFPQDAYAALRDYAEHSDPTSVQTLNRRRGCCDAVSRFAFPVLACGFLVWAVWTHALAFG
jgi:hypothetical protein